MPAFYKEADSNKALAANCPYDSGLQFRLLFKSGRPGRFPSDPDAAWRGPVPLAKGFRGRGSKTLLLLHTLPEMSRKLIYFQRFPKISEENHTHIDKAAARNMPIHDITRVDTFEGYKEDLTLYYSRRARLS